MEVERRASKGGFLNLFDWGGKSRKKLFSSSSEVPEGSKKGKENVEKLPKLQPSLIEVDESGASSSNRGSNDYNCASSVTSDEGYGNRVPGVVARLMGLDSLPTSNVSESCSIPFTESMPFKDTRYDKTYTNFRREHHNVNYNAVHDRAEGFSRNPVISTPQKMQSRPIERFQIEMLPPKSAKPIPITHHKLLSPIKSPAFIAAKNATYTMEAAAKLIEPSPQTAVRSKTTSFMSSSVPLRIRDLKEKMEAAQKTSGTIRPKEINAVNHMRQRLHQKNSNTSNGLEHAPLYQASEGTERSSFDSQKNKGKSVSLAVQAKVNVQRRDVSTSSSTSSLIQTECIDVKSNQFLKSQPNAQKSGQKRTSTNNKSRVLQQNNQKQNYIPNRYKDTSGTSVSRQQSRKSVPSRVSSRPDKTVHKVVSNSKNRSRKLGLSATDSEKELSSSRTKNFPRKTRSVNEDTHFEEVFDNVLIKRDGRSIQCNAIVDGCMKLGADNRIDGMDVVSFTFSSPIKRSIYGSQSSGQSMENKGGYGLRSQGQHDLPDSKYSKLSMGLNANGADDLSILLEQKLRELTSKFESSQSNQVETGPAASSASSLQDSVANFDILSTTSTENDRGPQVCLPIDKSDSHYDSDFSSVDEPVFTASQKQQDEHDSHCEESEARKELDCVHPIQVSTFEPSLLNESCYVADYRNSVAVKGTKQNILPEPHNEENSVFETEFQPAEGETEFSDSASSAFTVDVEGKYIAKTTSLTDFVRSTNWELQYVRDVLGNTELILDDFALGQAHTVITPNLFDHLENLGNWEERNGEEFAKLERKVLFDCVAECLDLRCSHISVGSCKAWTKWPALFQKKGWLAEELYKEISGLKSMEYLMVDDLLDKDMNSEFGRWLEFKTEAFEEGVEIQEEILHSLVEELVADAIVKPF